MDAMVVGASIEKERRQEWTVDDAVKLEEIHWLARRVADEWMGAVVDSAAEEVDGRA